MIKKAYKKPIEVEYIEFKGRENFKEVGEFLGERVSLSIDIVDQEWLIRNETQGKISYPIGAIFYKYFDESLYDYVVRFSDAKDFFSKYSDIN